MAIAAVPRYLGNDFSTASPGMRFGMYLKLWGIHGRTGERLWTTHDINFRKTGPRREEREFRDENKTACLEEARRLTADDQSAMKALFARQTVLALSFQSGGQLLRLEALAVAPFSTGLGNEHPLENGFSFLNPYGLPYLPGSGVKGVLRQAACELKSGEWGDAAGWDDAAIAALFGKEGRDGDTDHQRGALMFWDVIPQLKGATLQVEVMTPHQTHYYQRGETPHESGSPNPIDFLTVPPGSGFVFHVQCDRPFLARIASDLAESDRWKKLLIAAFGHAFDWLGFGAKTAVGYGQMTEDQVARERRENELQQAHAHAARQLKLAALSPIERSVEEALQEKVDPGLTDGVFLTQLLESGRWQGDDAHAIAVIVREKLKAEKKWKESSKKPEKDKEYKRTQLVLKFLGGT